MGQTLEEVIEASDYTREQLAHTGHENVDAMRHALKFAREEQSKVFHMGEWFMRDDETPLVQGSDPCGTTMCLAGAAVWLDLKPNEAMGIDGRMCKRGGSWELVGPHYEIEGRNLLGLTYEQSDFLFYLDNDIELVEAAMELMAGESLQ